ncbi:hypothetical protein Tco_1501282 [Tanacetum coccineum]
MGLKDLRVWNKSIIVKHRWHIVNDKESLWVKWINIEKLRGRSVWEVEVDINDSWGWKHILNLRKDVRKFMYSKIGDGNSVSVWYDNWSNIGTLDQVIIHRTFYDARLRARMTIKELMGQSNWEWPKGWTDEFPILQSIQRPILNEYVKDKVLWKRENGKLYKIKQLGSYDVMRCPLCKNDTDSHSHLFFECEFSKTIWEKVTWKTSVNGKGTNWNNNVEAFAKKWNGNSINNVIRRISLAASVYLVWQEKNNRIFKDEIRSPDEIYKTLEDIIKMRLMSLTVKNSVAVKKAQEVWNVKLNIIDNSDLQLQAPCILESTMCDCTH